MHAYIFGNRTQISVLSGFVFQKIILRFTLITFVYVSIGSYKKGTHIWCSIELQPDTNTLGEYSYCMSLFALLVLCARRRKFRRLRNVEEKI